MTLSDFDQFLFDTLSIKQLAMLSFAFLYNPDHNDYYMAFKSGDYDKCKQYILDNKDEIKMENVQEEHKEVAKQSIEQYENLGAEKVRQMYKEAAEKQEAMAKRNAEEDERAKTIDQENIDQRLEDVEKVFKFKKHTEAKGSELTQGEKLKVIDSTLIVFYLQELDDMKVGNFGLQLEAEAKDAIDTILNSGWRLSPKSMAENLYEIMIMAYGEENATKFAKQELPFVLTLIKTYHEEGREVAQSKVDEIMEQEKQMAELMKQQEEPEEKMSQEEINELNDKKLKHLKGTTYTKINFPTKEELDKAVDDFEAPEELSEAPEELIRMYAQQELFNKVSNKEVEGKTEFTFEDVRNDKNISFNSDNLIATDEGYAYTYPSYDENEQHDVSSWAIINEIVKKHTGEEGREKEEGESYYDYDKNEMVVFEEA